MIRLQAGKFFGQTMGTRRIGPFHITASCYRAGDFLPRHCHERAYLFVMLSGGIAERALRRENVCTRGWLVYNEAGEAHDDQVLEEGAEGINIEISPEWLGLMNCSGSRLEAVSYQYAGPALPAVGALQLALRGDEWLQTLRVEEAVLSLLQALGCAVERACVPRAWLNRLEELIRSQAPGLALADLARATGVHPAHCCREFRRAFGCSMTQYALRLRADAALAEVLRSRSPLAEVAARTGFADQAHLTRTFRDVFGTTPGKLRRECRRPASNSYRAN